MSVATDMETCHTVSIVPGPPGKTRQQRPHTSFEVPAIGKEHAFAFWSLVIFSPFMPCLYLGWHQSSQGWPFNTSWTLSTCTHTHFFAFSTSDTLKFISSQVQALIPRAMSGPDHQPKLLHPRHLKPSIPLLPDPTGAYLQPFQHPLDLFLVHNRISGPFVLPFSGSTCPLPPVLLSSLGIP